MTADAISEAAFSVSDNFGTAGFLLSEATTTEEDSTFLVRFLGRGCKSLIGATLNPLFVETLLVTR
jgi:hypothetical protein